MSCVLFEHFSVCALIEGRFFRVEVVVGPGLPRPNTTVNDLSTRRLEHTESFSYLCARKSLNLRTQFGFVVSVYNAIDRIFLEEKAL